MSNVFYHSYLQSLLKVMNFYVLERRDDLKAAELMSVLHSITYEHGELLLLVENPTIITLMTPCAYINQNLQCPFKGNRAAKTTVNKL